MEWYLGLGSKTAMTALIFSFSKKYKIKIYIYAYLKRFIETDGVYLCIHLNKNNNKNIKVNKSYIMHRTIKQQSYVHYTHIHDGKMIQQLYVNIYIYIYIIYIYM